MKTITIKSTVHPELVEGFLAFLRTSCIAFLSLYPLVSHAAQVEAPYMTATRYNPAGQVTGVIKPDPDGAGSLRLLSARNTYDATGLLTKVESGELNAWQPETTDPANWSGFTVFSTTLIGYDAYGRKILEYTKGRDGVTIESEVEYSYDDGGRILCKAIRLNKAAFSATYVDACTARALGNDGPDRIYRYTYDTYDQVLTETRAYGTSLQETYVTNSYLTKGKLDTQTDANGNLTKLSYDTYGRLQYRYYPSKTSPGTYNTSDFNQYTYDGNGNVTVERKRNGTTITNTYDANNRLTFKDLSDNTYQQDVSYNYDARGLMLSSKFGSDSGAGIATSYDGFGRIVSTTNNMGGYSRTLSYQYDNNSNRTRITHPDGWFFQYGFDGLNRVNALNESTAANPGAGTSSLLTVVYQPNGSPSYIARNGTASVSSITLDNANRVQNLFHDFPGTTNDLTNTFTYNAASQIIQLDQSNTTYSYMGNDNKTGAYAVNGLNQYTSINGATINYDANGNETYDGTTTYTYDMENHLVATSGGVASSLTYDPQGRLFQSTISGVTTQFLYDNTALVAEYVGGTMTKRYVHGDQVDQPLVQYSGSAVGPSARQYLHADHQGSIIAMSDNAGNVQTKYTYDNFGIPGSAADYRFAYTGQIWFKNLKLYYYKARFYSPYQGRFMQTDPIFYKDDMDLYSYVGNDPMDRADPSGLAGTGCFAMTEGQGAVCAGAGLNMDMPITVNNKSNWQEPKLSKNPGTEVKDGAAERSASPYKEGKLSAETRKEIGAVADSKVFRSESGKIWNSSIRHGREMGALRVYKTGYRTYDVYSVGKPSATKANGLTDIPRPDSSFGTNLFLWHPHPWHDSSPSSADLGSSVSNGEAGMIQYSDFGTSIFVGECKSGAATC